MPRFFFDVHDGTKWPDKVGIELASLEAVRSHAARLMAQMLQNHPGEFWNGKNWHLDVTDDTGLTLFSLNIVATDAPVLKRASSTDGSGLTS